MRLGRLFIQVLTMKTKQINEDLMCVVQYVLSDLRVHRRRRVHRRHSHRRHSHRRHRLLKVKEIVSRDGYY
jgi:hypothetical protein